MENRAGTLSGLITDTTPVLLHFACLVWQRLGSALMQAHQESAAELGAAPARPGSLPRDCSRQKRVSRTVQPKVNNLTEENSGAKIKNASLYGL